MLVELPFAYVLFQDSGDDKVVCVDNGKVLAAGEHGRELTVDKDYFVIGRHRDGWETLRDTCFRHNISRSSGTAVVVDSLSDLRAWVKDGAESGVTSVHIESDSPSPVTTEAETDMFGDCDPLFKSSLLADDDDRHSGDLSTNTDWQALQQGGRGERVVPRNRLERWPFNG